MIGLEPITCWLQISCSANWATSAYIFISWFVISCSACDQLTSFVDLSELSHIGVYYIYLSDYSDKRTLFWESFSVTPTGIEPVLPPWKGDVLTAWPRSLIYFAESLSDTNNSSIDIYKYQVLFLISFIFCNFTVPVRIKHTFYKNQKKTCSFYCRSAPRVGLEPTTLRLTAECSTIELSRII